jgi:hypothetical protein
MYSVQVIRKGLIRRELVQVADQHVRADGNLSHLGAPDQEALPGFELAPGLHWLIAVSFGYGGHQRLRERNRARARARARSGRYHELSAATSDNPDAFVVVPPRLSEQASAVTRGARESDSCRCVCRAVLAFQAPRGARQCGHALGSQRGGQRDQHGIRTECRAKRPHHERHLECMTRTLPRERSVDRRGHTKPCMQVPPFDKSKRASAGQVVLLFSSS